MAFGTLSLKGKALQWLAQREHSRAELQSKLLRYAADRRRQAAATAAEAKEAAQAVEAAEGAVAAESGSVGAAEAGTSLHIKGRAATLNPAASWSAPDHDLAALDEAQVTRVLDELAAAGFQSDSRTAQSAARTKSPRYGVHRLKQHLRAIGLGPELVASTVGDAQATELARAQELWRRRFGEPTEDRAQLAKQVRFLTSRGFDSDTVRRVVRGLPDTD